MIPSVLDRDTVADEDTIVNSPFAFVTSYNISIFYILWYFVVTHWTLASYVSWIRFNGDLLDGRPPTRLYLTFLILAMVNFWVVSGPMFFYTAKYRKNLKDRNRWLSFGIVLAFLFSDLPIWLLDMTIVYYHGFIDVIQMIAMLLRFASFVCNAFISWHIYMHRLAKYLHAVYDTPEDIRKNALEEEKMAERKRQGMREGSKKMDYR